jgi:hypothetical protein
MAGFDPAKEPINLSKHGISLSRWVDLEVLAVIRDVRRTQVSRIRTNRRRFSLPGFHDS